MKYCQECGSEIADTVVFCPFCGISQKHLQGKEESAQENTIALNQWELADIVGNKTETVPKDLSSRKSDILPETKVEFSEKQEVNKEFEQPQNVPIENQVSKDDSMGISPQFMLNTDDSFNLTPDKEV